MKKSISLFILIFSLLMAKNTMAQDWPNLNRYALENEKLQSVSDENRVVFMGNSITEGWLTHHPDFFSNKSYINRGIGGQTTPQMLLRFRQDVINLKPKTVVILAGINDIAGNTGPSTLEMILNNIISMVELAKVNNIKVILCSVLPANNFYWNPGTDPAEKVIALNQLIQNYAKANDIPFIDYHTPMKDAENGLKKEYGPDGVHPNLEGYKVMAEILNKVI
ncbi:lysophospholipase L1-like esterase [Flavobacterium arsenatis]|uniref:Lysophospholipase L1-like esterase n=1 Tax=Flavobacterium arsenatis TaxID=1484332 RepID=A0ABU1TM92_9FLAO|nr:SGNH/GDSL hydrolase family protein [Flavobacterium arsenatis]MDR6967089.1 lysophospholipase L1-like esterase [Flavobacterium arsenatis]